MAYEQTTIDGVPHFRHSPNYQWKPVTVKFLAPNHPIDELLNVVQAKLGTRNRTETLETSGLDACNMSRIRHGKIPTAEFILRFHDLTDLSVDEIRDMFGIKKYNANLPGGQQAEQTEETK